MISEKLKTSLLQTAMEGRITEQLREDGSTKQEISSLSISNLNENLPFDIPENWQWVTFGDIVEYKMGKTPPREKSEYWGKGYNWISIADMRGNQIIENTNESVTSQAISDIFRNNISPKGTLVMSFKLTVGRVSFLGVDAVHNEAIISIYPKYGNDILSHYLSKILPMVTKLGDTKDAIKGKTLNSKSISKLLIPLPPLKEQVRIVKKLDELLPLIDSLEKDELKLKNLMQQFPDRMKDSILQAAIHGKLVEQSKEDGNALDLLNQIHERRQHLLKEGNQRVIVKSEEILDEEKPFDIPENWVWSRLSDCCIYSFSGKSPKYTSVPNNNIAIGQRNNQNYGLDFNNVKYCTDEFMKNYEESMFLKEYDVILNTLGGGTVGRAGLYLNPNGFKCITDGHLFVFRSEITVFQKYLYYVLRAFQKNIEKDAEGSTNQSFLKLSNVRSYLIPVPPLKEQKRIISKLEVLLSVIEKINAD